MMPAPASKKFKAIEMSLAKMPEAVTGMLARLYATCQIRIRDPRIFSSQFNTLSGIRRDWPPTRPPFKIYSNNC